MATYPVQSPGHGGAQITFAVPANGDIIDCVNGMGLMIVNPPANGNVVITMPTPPFDGVSETPRAVTVPQGTTWVVPLPSWVYGSTCTVTYTGTLGTVGVALLNFPLS